MFGLGKKVPPPSLLGMTLLIRHCMWREARYKADCAGDSQGIQDGSAPPSFPFPYSRALRILVIKVRTAPPSTTYASVEWCSMTR
jgi:hypothetical protein